MAHSPYKANISSGSHKAPRIYGICMFNIKPVIIIIIIIIIDI